MTWPHMGSWGNRANYARCVPQKPFEKRDSESWVYSRQLFPDPVMEELPVTRSEWEIRGNILTQAIARARPTHN